MWGYMHNECANIEKSVAAKNTVSKTIWIELVQETRSLVGSLVVEVAVI